MIRICLYQTLYRKSYMQVTEDVRKAIIDNFCAEYEVDRDTMPELTDEFLADIVSRKNGDSDTSILVTTSAGEQPLIPILVKFLIQHLDDRDIPELNTRAFSTPEGCITLISEKIRRENPW